MSAADAPVSYSISLAGSLGKIRIKQNTIVATPKKTGMLVRIRVVRNRLNYLPLSQTS
jgi:hypothetical protein